MTLIDHFQISQPQEINEFFLSDARQIIKMIYILMLWL